MLDHMAVLHQQIDGISCMMTWIDPEGIMLSEIKSEREKNKHYMITLVYEI